MMRRILIVGVALCSLLATPRPASAGFWAWLQELSGPGPFKAKKSPILAANCLPVNLSKIRLASDLGSTLKQSAPDIRHCIYIDTGFFHADADTARNFPAIDVKTFDIGGSIRIAKGADIGSGFTWLSFKNSDTDAGKSQWTITPIRLVTRPLALAFSDPPAWTMIFNIYWKETYLKPIDGSGFGADPAVFRSRGELLQSFGVLLDFSFLVKSR